MSGGAIRGARGKGSKGGAGQQESAAAEGGFVPYLPREDEAETRQVLRVLSDQLRALLCLPPRQFWKRVATDATLGVALDSFLQFRRRWFDSSPRTGAGDDDVDRLAFMVLLRMSSSHEPGGPPGEGGLSPKHHAALVLEGKLLDVPKLMDVAAIYGRTNPDLTRRLVANAFGVGPAHYAAEWAAHVRLLGERVGALHGRCVAAVEGARHGDEMLTAEAIRAMRGELSTVADFLSDAMITVHEFVTVYPPAASVFHPGSAMPGQGEFLRLLATVHDATLPVLKEGFRILRISEGRSDDGNGFCGDGVGDAGGTDPLLRFGNGVVDLAWKLLELQYLDDDRGGDGSGAAAATGSGRGNDDHGVQRGDGLLRAVDILAAGDGFDWSGKAISSAIQVRGGLVMRMERRHRIWLQVRQACQRGVLVLNDAQQKYLLSLVSDERWPDRGQDEVGPLGKPAGLLAAGSPQDREAEEEAAVQQSKVSQVKDLFPDYGDGFVAMCLEVYNNDPEAVIQRILENTLHSDLQALDSSLATKPTKPTKAESVVEGKGKGKLTEEPATDPGTTARTGWKERKSAPPAEQLSGPSFSSEAGNSGAAGGEPSARSSSRESDAHPGPPSGTGGRFVRKQAVANGGTFGELHDSGTGDKRLSAAIRAVAAQMAYEDEYDDSFDDLGDYEADAGGNEETECLADRLPGRTRAQDRSAGSRTGKPAAVTPWESADPTPRRPAPPAAAAQRAERPAAAPQKAAPPAPRVAAQAAENNPTAEAPLPAAGRGRGGGKGGGKKWKEQAPKSQFYLKDGKLYSYKVAGAVGVASVEEAESMKREEAETIHGLSAGGNVPAQPQGEQASVGERNARFEGGRGRGTGNQWKPKKDGSDRRRKDQAMKKHFGGLGGF